jgi:nucleotide-binding universal stress UspA family protein
MMKSILVAVDASPYSDAARIHAVALAKLYGARVVGVHVLDVRLLEMPPYLDYTYEGIPLTPMPLEILEGFRTKGDRALTLFREAAEAAGVPVEALMEEGVPADTIADLGDEHDLIVMGKRGEHARWGKDMLGSIAEGVARRATTPVLLTEEKPVEVRSLLVLFDGSHAAHRALKLGADVASHCGASVRVLTAGDDQAKAGAVQEEAHTYLEAFTLPVTWRLETGEVVMAAMADLENEPSDLVVMGTKGHSFLRRLVMGSVTEQLMRDVTVPVLLAP